MIPQFTAQRFTSLLRYTGESGMDITTEEKVEKLRRDVVMSDISKEEKNRKLGAIYDLHDYAAGLNRKSKKTKAYYIEMPTMAF